MVVKNHDDNLVKLNKILSKTKASAKWNGWNVNVFYPNPAGYYSPDGSYQDGQWGFVKTIEPDQKTGFWFV